MKLAALAGAALAIGCVVATQAAAEKTLPTRPGSNLSVITISCFRGPTSTVIWDRPNAVFVEDLVRLGYSYPDAHAIGERVCRDEYGVDQPEYLRSTLYDIMARTPPR
jgi:hypothetical protein